MTIGNENQQFDVFICHASEDKAEVARPLAEGLRNLGRRVWLDEYEIRVGDSLRRKIDEGLAQSRFGVVILSPSFFQKEWPQSELDGLAQREMSTGEKVVLPVWHDLTADEVSARSPLLARRLAAKTEDGLEAVVGKIEAVFESCGDIGAGHAPRSGRAACI